MAKLYETINAENWHQGDYVNEAGDRRCIVGWGVFLRVCRDSIADPTIQHIVGVVRVLFPEVADV